MTVTGPVVELVEPHQENIALWARIEYDVDLATEEATRAGLHACGLSDVTGGRVIVEFGPGRFVAISGLRVLLDLAEAVRRRGGEFEILHPPPSLRRMHELLRLGSTLPLVDDIGGVRPHDATA